jgi:hypothetical protein
MEIVQPPYTIVDPLTIGHFRAIFAMNLNVGSTD